MPVDPSQLGKAIAQIRKTYGEDAIHDGDTTPPLKRISTGSLEFDLATGGGIPLGRWSHFYGGYSSSKTLTGWNIIAEAQKLGLSCAYYNVENQYDEAWVAKRGIDTEKLQVVEGTTIEGIGSKLETLLGVVHVHVIDSLAAAVSVDELNADIEEWRPAIAARTWGKVFRRANERFDDIENAIIMINQVRDAFGQTGGEVPPGGRFIEFMSSLSVYFRKGPWLFRDGDGLLSPEGESPDTMSGDREAEGIEFAVRVQKSRVCPPLRTARMRLDFSTGEFDNDWAVFKAATYFGVVTKAGGWYKLPSGESIQGASKFRAHLAKDSELQAKIVEAMKNATAGIV